MSEIIDSDEDMADTKSTGSVQQLLIEDDMDKKERLWSKSVNIIEAFRKAVSDGQYLKIDTFFMSMYLIKVLRPRQEQHFFNFFDDNWQVRHYYKDSGKVCDEVIKNAQAAQKKKQIE